MSIYSQQQTGLMKFNQINKTKGLSQNSFNCILQDHEGFLWFGTDNGMIRYDGYTFQTFQNDPFVKNSLADNYVRLMAEDASGKIWIAGGSGLSSYNTHSGRFVIYQQDAGNKYSLPSDHINCISKDSGGRVWFGTDKGLFFYDDSAGRFVDFEKNISQTNLSGHNILGIVFSSDNQVWIQRHLALTYLISLKKN